MRRLLLEDYPPRGGRLSISDYPYQTRRAQRAGEHDLLRLARTREEEGVWMFAEGTWFNLRVGSHWRGGYIGAQTKQFPSHYYGRNVHHYHTHPFLTEQASRASYFEQLLHLLGPGNAPGILLPVLASKLAAFHNAIPTTLDLDAYRHLLGRSTTDLTFHIVSPHGVTDVTLFERRNRNRQYRRAREEIEERIIGSAHKLPPFREPLTDYVEKAVIRYTENSLAGDIARLSREYLRLDFTSRRTRYPPHRGGAQASPAGAPLRRAQRGLEPGQ